MGRVYRSPSKSNTILAPRGATSSDIHVPSEVVNRTVRGVGSGSESAAATTCDASGGALATVSANATAVATIMGFD
jgi:hypothetical protein